MVHERCLQCNDCGIHLEGTCFKIKDNVFCREHFYNRSCSPKCVSCNKAIIYNQLAVPLGNKRYHANCLKCFICGVTIQKGQNIGIKESKILCQNDLEKNEDKQTTTYDTCPPIVTKRSIENSDEDEEMDNEKFEDTDGDTKKNNKKHRVPHIDITSAQMKILKSTFKNTRNPNRHQKVQVAKETGLTLRRVQIWFQNQRSIEKRLHTVKKIEEARSCMAAYMNHHGTISLSQHNPYFSQHQHNPHQYQTIITAHPALYPQQEVSTHLYPSISESQQSEQFSFSQSNSPVLYPTLPPPQHDTLSPISFQMEFKHLQSGNNINSCNHATSYGYQPFPPK